PERRFRSPALGRRLDRLPAVRDQPRLPDAASHGLLLLRRPRHAPDRQHHAYRPGLELPSEALRPARVLHPAGGLQPLQRAWRRRFQRGCPDRGGQPHGRQGVQPVQRDSDRMPAGRAVIAVPGHGSQFSARPELRKGRERELLPDAPHLPDLGGPAILRPLFAAGILFAAAVTAAAPPPDYDLILRGGWIVDGCGNPPFRGDLGIRADRIAAIAPRLKGPAAREISVEGLVVAPGFIDLHTHARRGIFENPGSDNYVR